MVEEKLNCWQFMRCGREHGGKNADELGVCPATTDSSFNGINSGKNAGRICWAVAGTFCNGKIQGTFAEKRRSCVHCNFFKSIISQETSSKLSNDFLRFISEDAPDSFLNNLSMRKVRAGERFIVQGDYGDKAYIIHSGSCLVIVEKQGSLHPVDHRGAGDIVGLQAILTGEPQMAHVEAETDVELWVIKKNQFNNLSSNNPEMLRFLTELVASRFDTSRPIADRTIGKYIITDIIGRGTFSIVYKGIHRDLNMPVAIKMMRHDLVLEPEFLKNFKNEATTIAALNHDNILKVYDIEEVYKTIFIIMEYLEGEPLSKMFSRLKIFTPRLATHILLQICAGLGYAHEKNNIHRDINPMNIMVLPSERVKILDFGLACPVGTETYEFFGNMAYNSPEQINGDPVDQRSDIYSLGVLAYEMLTGKRPFPEESVAQIMKCHLNYDVPDPGEIMPMIPSELRAFVIKAGRRNPKERFKDINAALSTLRPLVSQYGLTRRPELFSKRKMATLFLFYDAENQNALNRLMESFHEQAKSIGIDLKPVNFYDV